MTFTSLSLNGSYIVDLNAFTDERGWFARYYCKDEFSKIGHTKDWVQMNHSAGFQKGTLRGLHYQIPPYSEIKLVRCIAGKIFDVIVDLRQGSPTFLQWQGIELSAENRRMIYIPEGFAHGFQTLTDNCELLYHHSAFYTPKAEKGIKYDDPAIAVQWPEALTVLSSRDASHQLLDKNFKGI